MKKDAGRIRVIRKMEGKQEEKGIMEKEEDKNQAGRERGKERQRS